LRVAAQRADQLLLAVELRLHALELEILLAAFLAQLRRILGLGFQRFDQLLLTVDPPLVVCRLLILALLQTLELGYARALLVELTKHERQLGAPVCEQPGQTVAEVLNRQWSVGHDGMSGETAPYRAGSTARL